MSFSEKVVPRPNIRRMSAHTLSIAALCVASYTWWASPPAQPLQIIEVPAPSAEFSCSAKCPTPAPPIVIAAAESTQSASACFWILVGAVLSALAAWCVWPREPPSPLLPRQVVSLPYLAVGTSESEEHVGARGLEPEIGSTPQRLRLRRLRALKDAA